MTADHRDQAEALAGLIAKAVPKRLTENQRADIAYAVLAAGWTPPEFGLRVEISHPALTEPATCKVWIGGGLAFDGVQRGAFATIAPANPSGEVGLREAVRDGSRDLTIGAVGENDEPTDHGVRELAALGYLAVSCDALGIDFDPDESDDFTLARAIYRRLRALTQEDR